MTGLPTELSGLKSEFEQWRMLRHSRWEKLPESLWNQAAVAGNQFGLSKVAKLLALDYYQLKARCSGKTEKHSLKVPSVTKILLPNSNTCGIEVVAPSGFVLRVPSGSSECSLILAQFFGARHE